jgi:hypothetical protein
MNIPKTALLTALLPVLLLSAEPVSAHYDPGTQRWLSRDPIQELGGFNLYRYVSNNPSNMRDAFGECPLASPSAATEWGKGTPQLATGEALKETGKGLAIMAGIVAGAAGFGALIEATPAILGWLGLGGAAAETPQGQNAMNLLGQTFGKLGTVVNSPGQSITGFTYHGFKAAADRNLNWDMMARTVNSPLVVLQQTGGNYLYVSKEAAVALNSAGQINTTYTSDYFDSVLQMILSACHAP